MPKLVLQSIQIPLACEPFTVQSMSIIEGALHLRMAHEGYRGFCPYCGEPLHPHQKRVTSLRSLPIDIYRKVFWDVERTVMYCPNCDKHFTEKIPFQFEGMRCTTTLAKEVCDQLDLPNMNIKAVAAAEGLPWDTVKNIQSKYLNRVSNVLPPPDGPKLAVVDEFSIERGQKYATLVINGKTKETLHVAKGRSKESFEPFFDKYEPEFYSGIEAIAMDQNAQYNVVAKKRLPGVPVVCDYFHMVKNYSNLVLDKVRLRAARASKEQGDKDSYRVWKRSKRLLSTRLPKHADDIPDDIQKYLAQQSLMRLMEQNREVDICVHMREKLQRMYETCRDRDRMKELWGSWRSMAEASGIPELAAFARNKSRCEDEILAHAEHPFSSGVIEGCMNKIKVIKRVAFGYRDWDYFSKRIFYCFLPEPRKKLARRLVWEALGLPDDLEKLGVDQQVCG